MTKGKIEKNTEEVATENPHEMWSQQELTDRLGELEVIKKTYVKSIYDEHDKVLSELVSRIGCDEIVQASNGVCMKFEPVTMQPVFFKPFQVKRTKCTVEDTNTLAAKTATEAGFTPTIPNVEYVIEVEKIVSKVPATDDE